MSSSSFRILARQQIPPPRGTRGDGNVAPTSLSDYVPAVPSQTFAHSAVASASIDDVWQSLDDPVTWESIGGVDRVYDPVIDAAGQLRGFSFDSVVAGKKYVGRASPYQRQDLRLMSWHVENSEIRGVTTVELANAQPGTTVTVTLQVESAGFMSGMFFPIIANAIGNGLPAAVDSFAAGFGAQPS